MYNNNKALLILASILTPAIHAQTTTTCSNECTTKDSTTDFTIQYNDRCTESQFLTRVTNTATQACLICLYNHSKGTSLTTISSVVKQLCLDGYATDAFPYSEITQKGAQFDNEHYAGGGEWNYEIETASGEDRLAVDAARVDDIYHYQAQRKVIEFPTDTIESFNPYTSNSINGIDDLDGCDLNAAYCCFAQDRQAGDNNGNCATPYEYNCHDKDPADNTNICYIDHQRSSKSSHVDSGFSIFGDLVTNKENIEGSVHCHGFAWGEDPLQSDAVYKGNLLFYISMYDHLTQRGYARNIPGSPMCACAENMAVVTRADCTQVAPDETTTFQWTPSTNTLEAVIKVNAIKFNACTGLDANNNLEERVKKLHSVDMVSSEKLAAVQQVLVGSEAGKCNAAIETFLAGKNISKIGSGDTASS
mmetsp:Transcript_12289/g.26706  ORF Transcript_12289/g.26706 Transcript_12289/m.26706 type:complete len:419 (-) Transcript_12289:83-1339(-)|eukprot:CAMPEP_0172322626 /NCGR_PEP_ID=MMETSP1058-20130122/46435_1 /TAXON_ID=83371 /ORGANISM="Detonula confervacea, Strain CCMP 353" /LENGTH=418 /DNA_ID=CAMNT_0013038419 /DNA_START=126 /DNA_END=1382 /DNA_ORIENTATION=-